MSLCLTTPAPNPERSATLLAQLGFEPVVDGAALWTDGAALLHVDPAPRARAGIQVWRDELGDGAAACLGGPEAAKFDGGQLLVAPSGTPVWVMDGTRPEVELGSRGGVLGKFAGISLETPSLARSVEFWGSLLGARVEAGGVEQGWLTLRRAGMADLSCMAHLACPHSFANPSFTYFNGGDNPSVIDDVRRRGVSIFEEVAGAGGGPAQNIILREPGGVGFFVFND